MKKKTEKFPIKYVPNLFAGFPVCLVSVDNNLCTISMIQVFSYSPLRLGIGINPRSKTHELIRTRKKFVINFLTKKMVKAAKICGTLTGHKAKDKYKSARLTPEEFSGINCVKQSPVKILCKVIDFKEIGNRNWFFVKIEDVRISEDILNKADLLYFGDGIFGYIKKFKEF